MDWELLDTVRRGARFAALIVAALIAPAARAAVIVSSDATQNMTCTNGVCAPTAAKAVLNAGDLETLLASGDVEVTTTGEGVQAKDITIKAPVGWSSGSVLTLDAQKSIAIDQPISITGPAGLTLRTNDGGKKGVFSLGPRGNVSFANLASSLTINGAAYTLVSDIATLASDIAANPSGDFALAANYDASENRSNVAVAFTGTFEGLGNVISNFSWAGSGNSGLFAEVYPGGVLRDIGMVNADVTGTNRTSKEVTSIGALAGSNSGAILSSYSTGTVTDRKGADEGGLVGVNVGTITNSHAAVAVSAVMNLFGKAGGLVGGSTGSVSGSYASGAVSGFRAGGLLGFCMGGTVTDSYATGNVKAGTHSTFGNGGGLAGFNERATISNSYATGLVQGGDNSDVGGLIGDNQGTISLSYSTGSVSGGTGSLVGGLIGDDEAQSGSLDDTYWDTDTSGITNLSQGAGNIDNDPGITGLTTAQFQSGLPAGFDPKVWAEEPNINGGLPYLLANPPPKHK
jgi:hypothetical protein